MRPEELDRLLFDKLPAIYQIRDAEQGHSLRALLRVIAEQVSHSQQDIQQLYANWFVETCEPWVIPYIGELVGIQTTQGLIEHREADAERNRHRERLLFPRREVAKAVNYHRRKGTLSVLEDLANDIAGWPARAVEFHNYVARFGSVNERVLFREVFADVRKQCSAAREGTPFDTRMRFADVRLLESVSEQAYFNPQNVGLYIWRMKAHSLTRTLSKWGRTVKVEPTENGKAPAEPKASFLTFYWLNPLGIPTQCVTRGVPEIEPTHIAEEKNVPDPISVLDLQCATETTASGMATASRQYYGREKSLVLFRTPAASNAGQIPASLIVPMDLAAFAAFAACECDHSPDREQLRPSQDVLNKVWSSIEEGEIALDPVLGLCAERAEYNALYATYHYAAPGEVGGGEYPRKFSSESGTPDWVERIRSEQHHPEINLAKKLEDAREQRKRSSAASKSSYVMVLEICDSGVYHLLLDPDHHVQLEPGEVFELRGGQSCRPTLIVKQSSRWRGEFVRLAANSALILDGVVMDGGGLTILPPVPLDAPSPEGFAITPDDTADDCCQAASQSPEFRRGRVVIRHSTLRPHRCVACGGFASLLLERPDTCVVIEQSIIGQISTSYQDLSSVPQPPCELLIRDSIVDGLNNQSSGTAISGLATINLTVERSTILGEVRVREIPLARDSVFRDLVSVTRKQSGGMRYCYVPPNRSDPMAATGQPSWDTPPQYCCQPSRELSRAGDSNKPCGDGTTGALEPCDSETAVDEQPTPLDSIVPEFTSLTYGDSGYCQLTTTCRPHIRRGAEDESEMGVFHDLYEPQREANLKTRLEEFVPVSMNLGLIYVN